jgi:hypothetical protein
MAVTPRRFPPPWSVDDPDMKLGQSCHIVRDANGQALAYVYRLRDDPERNLVGRSYAKARPKTSFCAHHHIAN